MISGLISNDIIGGLRHHENPINHSAHPVFFCSFNITQLHHVEFTDRDRADLRGESSTFSEMQVIFRRSDDTLRIADQSNSTRL